MSESSKTADLQQLADWISALYKQLTEILSTMAAYEVTLSLYRHNFPNSFDYKMRRLSELARQTAIHEEHLSNIQNWSPKTLCGAVTAIDAEISKIQTDFDAWVQSQDSDDLPPSSPQCKRRGRLQY